MGVDDNSLYPSVFSSIPHSFNLYTNHVMWMPGSLIKMHTHETESFDQLFHLITDPAKMYVNESPYLFMAEMNLICPEQCINALLKFPPVLSHHEKLNVSYDCKIVNKIHTSNREIKLTCLLNICGKYMAFSKYYLWLLLDLGLVITELRSVAMYMAHILYLGCNWFPCCAASSSIISSSLSRRSS